MSKESKKSTKRVLSVSLGVAAITAVEGLACGNPVAPRYERTAPWSTEGDAAIVDAQSDAGVAEPMEPANISAAEELSDPTASEGEPTAPKTERAE